MLEPYGLVASVINMKYSIITLIKLPLTEVREKKYPVSILARQDKNTCIIYVLRHFFLLLSIRDISKSQRVYSILSL